MIRSTVTRAISWAGILCLGLWGFSTNVQAYVNAPIFSPQPLTAGSSVQMTLSYGDCDILGENPGDPTLFPNVVVTGTTIRVELFGLRFQDSITCVVPPSQATFEIGAFNEGSYQVEVVLASPIPEGFEYLTLSQTPAIIEGNGASAVPLPVNGNFSLIALAAFIMLFALLAMRERSKSAPRKGSSLES